MANRTPFCAYNYNIKKRKNQEKITIIFVSYFFWALILLSLNSKNSKRQQEAE